MPPLLLDTLRIPGEGASHKVESNFRRAREFTEGTREGVLKMIEDWRRNLSVPICWVSGSLGVGKSSIALRVAEQLDELGDTLITSFFLDTGREPHHRSEKPATAVDPYTLVPTIAQELRRRIPCLTESMTNVVSMDPGILNNAPEVQFQDLILKPLQVLHETPGNTSRYPNLVIIDGMDDDKQGIQERILTKILSSYPEHPHFHLRFLIFSRPEPWIQGIFDQHKFKKITLRISLDDPGCSPERDLRQYYEHKFKNIRSHYSTFRFPDRWPPNDVLDQLVQDYPTQFLHASDITNFVGPTGNAAVESPVKRFRSFVDGTVLDHLPIEDRLFFRLNSRYKRVLEVMPKRRSQLLKTLRCSLAVIHFLFRVDFQPSLALVELLLGCDDEVGIALQAAYSVLDIRGLTDGIRVYHKSFGDFLSDITRSGEFYIGNEPETLAHTWFQALFVEEATLYTG
ncbi:hypothetical protein V5O48_010083 [Marasmius crinis-equi]|uniref:Nephrocystin 3-like N-terminal domain-containing protein n=1 Tax=Marasmius crinis-equi TaxID=585013 RepID=A0ABR3F9B2_9AGAR